MMLEYIYNYLMLMVYVFQTDIRYSVELKGHTDSVDQLDWDPTHPDRLATASCDKTARIWDQRCK